MTMWDHLDIHPAVANLLTWQRRAALNRLDEQIAKDHAAGYGVDADRMLERRLEIMQQQREGRV